MATPTPTPYRNIGRDIEMEDANAEHLKGGVEDAKARLKIAAEQYKANPSKPVEDIYNKATQDLLDRTNRMEKARTRARELEIEAAPKPNEEAQPSRSPSSILSLLGSVPTEEAEAAKKVDQPKPYNLETIMALAAKKAAPRTATPTPAPTPMPEPTPEPSALEKAAMQASAASNAIRRSGATAMGQKTEATIKDTDETTATKNLALDQEYMDTMGKVIRSTPEWKSQTQGLDDMEFLAKLQAEGNAKQMSLNLAPLGAYEDMINSRYGEKSNFAQAFNREPASDKSFENQGEIQRRKGDMAKELINLIRASKVGQIVTKDGVVIGTTSGFEAPRPVSQIGQGRLEQTAWSRAIAEKHKQFDKSDNAMGSLNTVIRELTTQIPSDINRLKIQRAMIDMNGMRPALAEVLMESGNGSLVNRFNQAWDKIKIGRNHSKKDMEEFWESAKHAAEAIKFDRKKRALQFRETMSGYNIPPSEVDKLVSPDYIENGFTNVVKDMPEKLPEAAKSPAKAGAKKSKLSDEQIKALMGS